MVVVRVGINDIVIGMLVLTVLLEFVVWCDGADRAAAAALPPRAAEPLPIGRRAIKRHGPPM